MQGLPLFFRFTFRLLPGMQYVFTAAGLYLLVRGISEAHMAESQASDAGV